MEDFRYRNGEIVDLDAICDRLTGGNRFVPWVVHIILYRHRTFGWKIRVFDDGTDVEYGWRCICRNLETDDAYLIENIDHQSRCAVVTNVYHGVPDKEEVF